MSRGARSLFVFGVYVITVGAAFVLLPGKVISWLHLPTSPTGWVRIVGLLALVIGTYDVVAARAESIAYVRASVLVRFGFALGVTLVFASGEMPASILPLAAIDAVSAVWTAIVLRRGPSIVAESHNSRLAG